MPQAHIYGNDGYKLQLDRIETAVNDLKTDSEYKAAYEIVTGTEVQSDE